MERRDFFKKSMAAGFVTALGSFKDVFGLNIPAQSQAYDLVAVKGGEPDDMFDKGIASLGGMKNFVKKNQKVVVKPNIGWDVTPEKAANTNPKLVARIIKHCFDAGAKEVLVFDNTCDNWIKCYQNSGIEKAVKDAKGKIVPGNSESYYQNVDVKKGKRLTKAKVHELILDCDVFINVPILKNHGSVKLTIAMKNLMGIVWDRGYWHRNDLHQCIADFATYERQPDLNIVDAYNVMMQNGPRGVSINDVTKMKSLLIAKDMVAIDAAATKIFGMEPEDVKYIKVADEMKVGTMNLQKLNINRITV
ncbi:MAG TPA: DUF362 domain-containing protein [Ignavibacteriaceae bacterium]|nr:DUF362 domain-containing protein [Ignavibacteriaceae bacterium]